MRELATGKSRKYELSELLATRLPITVPQHNPADGITAVHGVLGVSWFDRDKVPPWPSLVSDLIVVKQNWHACSYDDASHGSDAMRTGAVGIPPD